MNTPPWPDPPLREAFYGLSGEIVSAIEPHSEADPVALLVQVLAAAGSALGRGPHFVAEADRHFTNIFVTLVGISSKGRKGTSWGHVSRLFDAAAPTWKKNRIQSGLSSGEGLIWAVRDHIEKSEPIREKGRVVDYEVVITDPGVEDKRLLVLETELASTLRVLGREGNTLSALLRQAWDTGDLRILTKNRPAQATGAHISVIGHITRDELRRYLDRTESANGFANRFLWVCVKRSKILPEGGRFQSLNISPLVKGLAEAIHIATATTELTRDDEARELWRVAYPRLSEGATGLFGAVTSRAEAQVMRLACIYALLDRSRTIRMAHLQAALALWRYCEDSCRFIFGDALGDAIADEVLRLLQNAPDGLTRTEFRDAFNRHKSQHAISAALGLLQEHGLAYPVHEGTRGRPSERWFALAPATEATEAT